MTQTVLPFIGRSADRNRIEALLPRLHDGLSAALVVSGEAGIGKTRLLRHLVQRAEDVQTITISGYEAEVRLDFAALHRLLATQLDRLDQLPAPQRDTLATVFGLAAGPAPNRLLVGLAAMTLLEQAARQRPLLCVVDDIQWVDQETMDVLAFVARRLDAEGIGMVFGLRSSGQPPVGLAGIPQHRLAPMSEEDMRSLLSGVAATPPAPDVSVRLVTESAGNPLALLEYLRSLSPAQLAGTAALPAALPVGELLTAVLARQITGLPGPTRRMLLVLSAAGHDESATVLEACARLGIGPDAIGPAVTASVVETRPYLAFRHPLIRSAVYEGAKPAELRSVHAALAEVAQDRGSVDAAAWHWACATSGPDEPVAAGLERAAARARVRGGYAAQATLFTLAAQRSVVDSDEYGRRLIAAAEAHISAGNGTRAEQLLAGWTPTGSMGARLDVVRVEAAQEARDYRSGTEASMLLTAANKLSADELDLARRLLRGALHAALETRDLTVGVTLQEVAQALLHRPLPPGRDSTVPDRMHDALAVRCVAGYQTAAPLLHGALRHLREPTAAREPSGTFLQWLIIEDLWDDGLASTTWAEMAVVHQAEGAWASAWMDLACSAASEARHGRFESAQGLFDEAESLCVATRVNSQMLWTVLVEFYAWQGLETETRSTAATMLGDWSVSRRYGAMANYARLALTVLELGLGRYSDALAQAVPVARDDPPGHGSRILPDLVEAAVRADDHRLARDTLAELTVRATAAGTPWALGVLARSRALALDTSAAAEQEYHTALRLLGTTSLKTETARTQLVYGEWLRRRKRRRDAREQLSQAQAAFAGMGAMAFARRASGELVATGLEPIASPAVEPSALTPQERRVAELAAEGMTNSEIAEQLFLSNSTVDYHLSKVFRKLEITSRRRVKDKLTD